MIIPWLIAQSEAGYTIVKYGLIVWWIAFAIMMISRKRGNKNDV